MKTKTDFLIVGSGLYGSVLAERIANKLNKKVIILEKRKHIGGNCYSKKDKKTKSILKRINCNKTLDICNQERKLLKKYGGGCGLDIGITIENIKKNNFLFSKGIDAKNKKSFHKNKILTKKKFKKITYTKLSELNLLSI